MPLVRSQVVRQVRAADPPRDFCVNDVYHTIASGGFNPATDYQNHANEIRDLFAGNDPGSGSGFGFYRGSNLTVKVYDMADPKPRAPRATSVTGAVFSTAALAPRIIACCLSYRGGQNIPSHRGRIYIGPFLNAEMGENVPSEVFTGLLSLGHGLFDIGGENVAHVVHSPTKNTDTVVQTYWVNDLWDVMHSREEKEASRQTLNP